MLRFHFKSGYANAPQRYVIRTSAVVFFWLPSDLSRCSELWKSWQRICCKLYYFDRLSTFKNSCYWSTAKDFLLIC